VSGIVDSRMQALVSLISDRCQPTGSNVWCGNQSTRALI